MKHDQTSENFSGSSPDCRSRGELQNEYDDTADKLDEQQRAIQTQVPILRPDTQPSPEPLLSLSAESYRYSARSSFQIEFSKKKESELNKMKRDLDESGTSILSHTQPNANLRKKAGTLEFPGIKFAEALAALKKKGQDGATEMNDQLEQVRYSVVIRSQIRADTQPSYAAISTPIRSPHTQ